MTSLDKTCVLITGGCGFIGSHTAIEIIASGRKVVVLDNLANSDASTIARMEKLSGADIPFVRADVRDTDIVASTIRQYGAASVVHFAGLKSVNESVAEPLDYFDVNVNGTLSVVKAMMSTGARHLVFSSSATVYGNPASVPISEKMPLRTTNPYGRSKLIVEKMLEDLDCATLPIRSAVLRYFNPAGAHPSGVLGENPRGVPNNLMPYVSQVAMGIRPHLTIFGKDYPTHDGTGVRDYIHVVDLAAGHVKALDHLLAHDQSFTVNLGTGRGYSVLEVVSAFESASQKPIPYVVAARRPGDVASCFADTSLANDLLNWTANRTLTEMCADGWRWQMRMQDAD